MRRREREGEAAKGLRSQPARGLARDMGGVVVENDLDRGVGRIGGIEELEKFNEFAAAVAFLDEGVNVTDLPPEKWTPGYAAFASACCGVM